VAEAGAVPGLRPEVVPVVRRAAVDPRERSKIMPGRPKPEIVDRVPTVGGAVVLIEQHKSVWRRRYTWQCTGCWKPAQGEARYSRGLAEQLAVSHASKCTAAGESW
jgi:hypothetical protein